MKIRNVTLADAKEICDIYNYYIEYTAVTFETVTVSESEMQHRIAAFLDDDFPYFVGEVNGKIVGYCYLHNWNNRCAYSSTKEVTVYLEKDQKGKGLGTILYQYLFKEIHKRDIHSIIAGICTPNERSVRLHESFGFKQVSHMKEIGWKFDQWRDIGHWQLIINKMPPKILILCTGNSCRSQMAHGFLQSFDTKLLVYSAGTQPSGQVNPKAIEVMQEVGIDISHHTPHNVDDYTNDDWDYVITVCGGANEHCPTFSGKVNKRLHIGFEDPSEAIGTADFIQSEFIKIRDAIKKAFFELYCNEIKDYF